MSKQLSAYTRGFIYAFVHFSVDAACFYFLFSRLSSDPLWWYLAMFYDALAFVPQNFIGLLNDCFPKMKSGLIGCILVLAALIVPADIPALIILGIGNALAHVGGAYHTLHGSNGKIGPCGIYVSGGSFGVIAGKLAALSGISILVPLAFITISVILTIWVSLNHTDDKNDLVIFNITSSVPSVIVILLAFIAVAVRSYMGYAIPTDWNQTTLQAIVLFSFMGLGKMVGGLLCDYIGYTKTSFISLILSLPFLLFGNSFMILSLIGIGLFSMTMPVTVAILVSKLPKNPCFSFGITTIALFTGSLPAFFIRPDTLWEHQIIVLILAILAALCIKFSLKKGC
ncbi:MAG: MFS transporter [Lachnospiraceae bacterium]|nr:MFS transporter [Lachnospiraceae bacterium]